MKRIDVLGLGAVAVDDILKVNEFPRPDSKMPIEADERRAGGLAGTALVAACRMGRSCAYAGTLGRDELSRFIIDGFRAEGISVRHLVRRDGARPFHSTILLDAVTRTRTILYDARGVQGANEDGPAESVIASARVLLVDHVGIAGMVRAARIARQMNIPIVADFECDDDNPVRDLLGLVDHLIVPFEFARKVSGDSDPHGMVQALWSPNRKVVVVTRGSEGCWYTSTEEPETVFHQPAFAVDVVDSNGCGDVFHGVYAAGLSEGGPVGQRLRLAAAVAALKAAHIGGQLGIPSRSVAEEFLNGRVGKSERAQL